MEQHINTPENEQTPETTAAACLYLAGLPHPPEPARPPGLALFDFSTPQAIAYRKKHHEWRMLVRKIDIARQVENEVLRQKMTESLMQDLIVYQIETPPPSAGDGDADMADMLERNVKILNGGFEYYLREAAKSSTPDRKIGMGMRMQSQLAYTVDVWRRLSDFQNRKTK